MQNLLFGSRPPGEYLLPVWGERFFECVLMLVFALLGLAGTVVALVVSGLPSAGRDGTLLTVSWLPPAATTWGAILLFAFVYVLRCWLSGREPFFFRRNTAYDKGSKN